MCAGAVESDEWGGFCRHSCRNIAWIEEHCIIPEGRDVGKPVVLREWQRDDFRKTYDTPTRRIIISRGRKNAKALCLDTPIPTPNGWRTMREVVPGGYVYGADGLPARVLAASEVFEGKRCYRLAFSDGSEIVASEDHLWTTRHKSRPWESGRVRGRERINTVTTAQIAQSVNYPRPDGINEANHKIHIASPLESPDIDMPIAPYVLGAWLGDGSSSCARFTSGDEDLAHFVEQIGAELGGTASILSSHNRCDSIGTSGLGLHTALRESGLLQNKHIPEIYFGAGTAQRWALLQGLMDTDGTVARHSGKTTPRCSFTANRYNLAYGVWRLARSLGLKARVSESIAKLHGREIGPIWITTFAADRSSPVFRLPRKQMLLPETLGKRSRTLTIVACDEVPSVQTKCISVDSPDSLFLAGYGCVPTHNTAEAAFFILLHLCGPEAIQNSQLYSTAQSRDQAAVVFNLAAKMVRMSAALHGFIAVRDTAKELACPEMGTLFKALSADATTAYGLSPVLTVHDELGQVKGPRHSLYEALETATGAQSAPLSIIISTQAPSDNDLLSILIDDAKKGDDPETKLVLDAAPDDMDPFAEETVRLANPAFGDFQSAKETMAMAEGARRMPSREAEFRNLILNQRVEAYSPFVTKSVWGQSGDAPVFDGVVFGGLDLSEVNDLTALILVTVKNDVYSVKPVFWLPGEGLEDRARQDRVTYDVWAKQGYLNTTPGRSVEYEYVANYIANLFKESDVKKIAFDRWNMRHLRPWLIKAGMPEPLIDDRFQDFGQGFASMSPALRHLESLLLNAKIRHGNHPILQMCAANAVVKSDESGNRKLDKRRSRGRIDGMVALAMACAVANESAGQRQVYPVDLASILTDTT